MRAYADSSFIVRLVTGEADSPRVVAAYRELRSPKLFFLPLHALEVRNAILQRAFHQRRSVTSGERRHIARERDAALARLEHLVARGALLDVTLDMDAAIQRAADLSSAHTERLGARAIDLLHVASALTLESELFLTTDERQTQLAKAEGLKVVSPR
ncbi:MAG TPA: type II toxin-antitoxin system VapC family toxin [Verrucomicrobiales bacterium]|nr:type II toxin-antitoxin system VapC family toxin [Verrucomicrobiales bacterium]